MLLFADDLKLFAQVNTIDDHLLILNDISIFEQRCTYFKWTKTKCFEVYAQNTVFSQKLTITFDYIINGQSLCHVQEMKDLGIILSKEISFKSHIN